MAGRGRENGIESILREGETIMEVIEQYIDNGVIYVVVFALAIIGIIAIFGMSGPDIAMDEPFKVSSDTSNYSCVVSEVESELLLNCLKVK